MPRKCFVIMPFSTTSSCSEHEWTDIFDNLFRPAVEDSGLDYECRRSEATRGNIIAGIMQQLKDAYIVIADLTDRNANVFYELGVRHALTNRTIILAQHESDVPFDLMPYARHIYGWKTTAEKEAFKLKIRELLLDVDGKPDRADNPVSDFLERTPQPIATAEPVPVTPNEVATAQPLAGRGAEGLEVRALVRRATQSPNPETAASTIYRLTRRELRPLLEEAIDALNQRPVSARLNQNEIAPLAIEYIRYVESITTKVEEFGLASIEERWESGVRVALKFAGDWISLSERQTGRNMRPAKGAPAFLAWCLVNIMGAKAVTDDAVELAGIILNEPIEVEDSAGQFTHQPFSKRTGLAYPEAFLGYADLPAHYWREVWNSSGHLSKYFDNEEDLYAALVKWFVILSLSIGENENVETLYPMYRLLPQYLRAVSSLVSRLRAEPRFVARLAHAFDLTPERLKASWSERVARVNAAKLGSGYFMVTQVQLPDKLGDDITTLL